MKPRKKIIVSKENLLALTKSLCKICSKNVRYKEVDVCHYCLYLVSIGEEVLDEIYNLPQFSDKLKQTTFDL